MLKRLDNMAVLYCVAIEFEHIADLCDKIRRFNIGLVCDDIVELTRYVRMLTQDLRDNEIRSDVKSIIVEWCEIIEEYAKLAMAERDFPFHLRIKEKALHVKEFILKYGEVCANENS